MIKRTMLAKCGFKQEGNHICCVNFFLFLVGKGRHIFPFYQVFAATEFCVNQCRRPVADGLDNPITFIHFADNTLGILIITEIPHGPMTTCKENCAVIGTFQLG